MYRYTNLYWYTRWWYIRWVTEYQFLCIYICTHRGIGRIEWSDSVRWWLPLSVRGVLFLSILGASTAKVSTLEWKRKQGRWKVSNNRKKGFDLISPLLILTFFLPQTTLNNGLYRLPYNTLSLSVFCLSVICMPAKLLQSWLCRMRKNVLVCRRGYHLLNPRLDFSGLSMDGRTTRIATNTWKWGSLLSSFDLLLTWLNR